MNKIITALFAVVLFAGVTMGANGVITPEERGERGYGQRSNSYYAQQAQDRKSAYNQQQRHNQMRQQCKSMQQQKEEAALERELKKLFR
ncbi:MAG: hypothetical protein LBD46_07885 [Endomicrobium sp.]|jgi:hypothetical protein|nr:hypothetical protein [Endomicrobium sp.]